MLKYFGISLNLHYLCDCHGTLRMGRSVADILVTKRFVLCPNSENRQFSTTKDQAANRNALACLYPPIHDRRGADILAVRGWAVYFVTAIGANAFKGCSALTDATIGSSVATIGTQAFDGCDGLTTVMSRSVTPPVLAAMNCFNCYETAMLKVPVAAVEDYTAAEYWREFMEIIGEEINAGLGDVDGDGHIGIADVTSLVDYLLNGGDASFYVDNADIDEDGNIGIADVADLIDYLLSGDDD